MQMKLEKKEAEKTLKYIKKLWGFNVSLFDERGKVLAYA
jgi:spore cortex formation protein SpoVR/YcgB (stage V sporulation)